MKKTQINPAYWVYRPTDPKMDTVTFPYTARPTSAELLALTNLVRIAIPKRRLARLPPGKLVAVPRRPGVMTSTIPAHLRRVGEGRAKITSSDKNPDCPILPGGWSTRGGWWRAFHVPAVGGALPLSGWACNYQSMCEQWRQHAIDCGSSTCAFPPFVSMVVTLHVSSRAVAPYIMHPFGERMRQTVFWSDLRRVRVDDWVSLPYHVDTVQQEALAELNRTFGLSRTSLPKFSKTFHDRSLTNLREYRKNVFATQTTPEKT